MRHVIKTLRSTKSKKEALLLAYNILSDRYKGERVKTYTRIFEILTHDIDTLWNKEGFLHCHHINALLIELLIKSGHFTKEDLEKRWTFVWYISPHQYVSVKIDDSTFIDVDIWGKNYGIPFGKHAVGFNTTLLAKRT